MVRLGTVTGDFRRTQRNEGSIIVAEFVRTSLLLPIWRPKQLGRGGGQLLFARMRFTNSAVRTAVFSCSGSIRTPKFSGK